MFSELGVSDKELVDGSPVIGKNLLPVIDIAKNALTAPNSNILTGDNVIRLSFVHVWRDQETIFDLRHHKILVT